MLAVVTIGYLTETLEAKVNFQRNVNDVPIHLNQINNDDFTSVIDDMILIYQKILSPIKQQNCPMFPSCSNYAIQCTKKYGMKGLFHIIDRLNRCGHDLSLYKTVIVNAGIYYLDIP